MITYANIQIDIRLNEKWETLHKNIVKKYNRKFDKILYSSLYEEYIFKTISNGIQDVRRFNTLDFLLKNFELNFAKLTIEEVIGIENTIIEWFVKLGLLDKNYCIPKSKMAKFNPKLKKFQETLGDIQETLGDIQETLKKNRRQTMKNISKYKKKYGEKDHKTLAMIEKLNTINNELKNMSPVAQETLGDIKETSRRHQETKEKEKSPPYNPPLKEKEKGGEEDTRAREDTPTPPSTSTSFFLTKKTDENKDFNDKICGMTQINIDENNKKNIFFRVLNDENMILQKKWFNLANYFTFASQRQIEEAINKGYSPYWYVNLLYNCLLPTNIFYKEQKPTDKITITMRKFIDDLYNLLEKETRQDKKQNKQETLLRLYNEWIKNKNSNVYSIFNFVLKWCEKEKWRSDGEMHDKKCPDYTYYESFIENKQNENNDLFRQVERQRDFIDKIRKDLSDKKTNNNEEDFSLIF